MLICNKPHPDEHCSRDTVEACHMQRYGHAWPANEVYFPTVVLSALQKVGLMVCPGYVAVSSLEHTFLGLEPTIFFS